MDEDEQKIECVTHGDAHIAYVCEHLASEPQQRWICDYPSEGNPWPDAWCAACDRAFQQYGEWNDKNSNCLNAKITCNRCYEERKGSSVAPLMRTRSADWQPLISEAIDELKEKQDILRNDYGMSRHERWDWDQETSRIVFSNAGKPALVARIQFVGSISTVSDTWLWSWANASFEPRTFQDLLKVRDYGEKKDFASLTVPKWPADETDGWEMTAIATKILGAQGAYRTPDETGFSFMLLSEAELVQ